MLLNRFIGLFLLVTNGFNLSRQQQTLVLELRFISPCFPSPAQGPCSAPPFRCAVPARRLYRLPASSVMIRAPPATICQSPIQSPTVSFAACNARKSDSSFTFCVCREERVVMSVLRCCSSCCKDAFPTLMLVLYFVILRHSSSSHPTLPEDAPPPVVALVVLPAAPPPP